MKFNTGRENYNIITRSLYREIREHLNGKKKTKHISTKFSSLERVLRLK